VGAFFVSSKSNVLTAYVGELAEGASLWIRNRKTAEAGRAPTQQVALAEPGADLERDC